MVPTATRGKILIALQRRCTTPGFTQGDWMELGNLVDEGLTVTRHPRLLRALDWGDDDYSGAAGEVLNELLGPRLENLAALAAHCRLADWLAEHESALSTDIYGTPGIRLIAADLSDLTDPSAIHEQLARLRSIDATADPALAIGTAKDLLESTVKVLLASLGEPIEKNAKLPKLVERLHRALDADPSMLPAGDPATGPLRLVLGGLKSTAIGIVELRNKVGTGHGGLEATNLTGSSLGRLAIDAVSTYCAAMLSLHAQHRRRDRW
jgi:hypothetical protein